jgi:hypothetical protein
LGVAYVERDDDAREMFFSFLFLFALFVAETQNSKKKKPSDESRLFTNKTPRDVDKPRQ